ncbi:MAG: hypothetical protein HY897_02655 [Deltaproteobacteria bacterium]|nr:hypothetical protein [Deltaproteobacteria bacterium]
MIRGLLLGILILSLCAGCDEARSKFDAAQRDEQFQYADGALKKYFDIVQNHKDSDMAGPAKDRLFEVLKSRTREFTFLDAKSKEVLDYFATASPESKIGKTARELEAKTKFRDELTKKFEPFFDKMRIEDYTELQPFFATKVEDKQNDDLIDKIARREARGAGLLIQGYRFIDFLVEGPDRAGMIVARQEYYPESGTTGEVKYNIHCSKGLAGWVIASMVPASAHETKAR